MWCGPISTICRSNNETLPRSIVRFQHISAAPTVLIVVNARPVSDPEIMPIDGAPFEAEIVTEHADQLRGLGRHRCLIRGWPLVIDLACEA